eukprot:XP_016658079.1 PREDICTED: uncharacterized protein LOC107883120 [Acyrthosiphon pisum]
MKTVLKNAKSASRLRSEKGISVSMITSEYISEDCQAIQSSASPKVSSTKLEEIDINNTIVKRRNLEMNGSLREIVTPFSWMESVNNMQKALGQVFKYLNMEDLISASRVCTAWNLTALDKNLVSITLKCRIMYFCLFIKYF